jgi:CheY-like chemotaxis protein
MKKQCFVIMPFSQTNEKHTELYWTEFFQNFIKPSLKKFKYSCVRSDAKPSNIIKEIINQLMDSELVIAVLTDFNANVWYELGIRHSLQRGTIMIIEEGQNLPFDISQYGVIHYKESISGAKDFEKKLKHFIENIENYKTPDNPVSEFIIKRTSHQQKKVLWVDDYPTNHESIIENFRQKGIEFDIVLNTSQCLEKIAKEKYNLIITDMGRGPEKDAGIQMLKEIKKRLESLPPVFIFSGIQEFDPRFEDARIEGALLITSSPIILTHKMNEILGLQ